MENKKILILKNDRAGDFISSVRLITELKNRNNLIDIYLSKFNYNFNFLIPDCNYKQISFDLKIVDKVKVCIDIFKNKYDAVFILSPKNFYYFLPLIFRNIKFYAVVVNGKKRNRPINFLRKYLHKFSVRNRNKKNKLNIIQSNLSLIDIKEIPDFKYFVKNSSNLNYLTHTSNNYIFFQFKYNFFKELNWSFKEFELIINFLETKYEKVIFSSDLEKNSFDELFEKNYSFIDFEKNATFIKKNNKRVIYLKKVDPLNLFLIIKKANKILGPHGLITQLAYLIGKQSINLFNFKIKSLNDYYHQKISFSEWYSNMGINFIFLNSDINKSIRKISKFI